MTSGYDSDLAFVHDAGYDFHAKRSALELLQRLEERGLRSGTIVDVGCGSGVLSGELMLRGYDVYGFDLSARMIDIARKRVPDGRFDVASYLDAKLPRAVAIAAIGEIFNYTFDDRSSERALEEFGRRTFDALQSGGIFFFDICTPDRDASDAPMRGWQAGDNWACLIEKRHDPERMMLIRDITTFVADGEHYRRGHESHVVRLFDTRTIVDMMVSIGFDVAIIDVIGDERLVPGLVGVVATKP